jgi:hypothetical protein
VIYAYLNTNKENIKKPTAFETVSQSSPVIASDRRERGNLYFLTFDEIASVVSLRRNDIVTLPHLSGGL